MHMDWKIIVAAPAAAWLVVANAGSLKMPYNWGHDAVAPTSLSYQVGLDPEVNFNGLAALTVRSSGTVAETDFAAATAFVDANGYEGHRVRFSGMLRTVGVVTYAGAYLRANRSDRREWDFGLPANLPRGSEVPPATGDWHPVSVVIDVPDAQSTLGTLDMGLVLVGSGQAWLSDLRFEEVGDDVAATLAPIGLDPVKYAERHRRKVERTPSQVRQQPSNLALRAESPSQ
jgi:hypothetical protein